MGLLAACKAMNFADLLCISPNSALTISLSLQRKQCHVQPFLLQPSSAQPSPAQPSQAQPSSAQPCPAQPSPAQQDFLLLNAPLSSLPSFGWYCTLIYIYCHLCAFIYTCISWYLFFSQGHLAEIISLSFDTSGDRIITGSFDHTVVVWDASTGR